jgi:1,2-diacylglycerol 3-alpha-glucosyltransferase
MRIALFTDFSSPQVNGIVHAVNLLAKTLSARGHTVAVFTIALPDAPPPPAGVEEHRYFSFSTPGAWDWRLAMPLGLSRDCRAFAPDVLHLHSAGTIGFRACALKKKLRVPLVGTSHTFPAEFLLHNLKLDISWMRGAIRKLNSWYYNKCTLVSAPSRAMLQELIDFGLKVPTTVTPNAIDPGIFHVSRDREALRKEHSLNRFTVISCGRVVAEKHIDETMQAFKKAIDGGLDGELIVIGDGPVRGELSHLAERLGIGQRTRFTGLQTQAQIAGWMNAGDAYMLTSRADNQSLTLLQAMACGLPVIAVLGGGTPEVAKDGITALTAEPGDVEKLANALLTLRNPTVSHTVVEHSLQYIADHSTPDATAATMERCYAEAIRLNRASPLSTNATLS